MRALWLASWYPSKLDPQLGDFVQRHAEAVSGLLPVTVVYVVKDADGVVTKNVHVEVNRRGNLTERIVYYRPKWRRVPIIHQLASVYTYHRLFRRELKALIQSQGLPPVVHLHVNLNAGPVALWMKRRFGCRYLLTEHATAFLPEADDWIGRSLLRRRVALRVLQQASGVSAVSKHLMAALQRMAPRQRFRVIPNVVDTRIFYPVPRTPSTCLRLVHASSLSPQKNPAAMLQAFALLKQTGVLFEVDIFGPLKQQWLDAAKRLGLREEVHWRGLQPQAVLAAALQSVDALVLFSRYETFGCVVAEANACGRAVLATDLPVLREQIQEGVNGFFAQGSDSVALADCLFRFASQPVAIHAEAVAQRAPERFGNGAVAALFLEWYKSAGLKPTEQDFA